MIKLTNTDGYDVFINPKEVSSISNGAQGINHSMCSTIYMKSGETHKINQRFEGSSQLIQLCNGSEFGGIVNGSKLMELAPIKNMHDKAISHGRSYGLSHAGYDIRLKQKIVFNPSYYNDWSDSKYPRVALSGEHGDIISTSEGRFCLASAIEEFDMPNNLAGIVHDKSTNARLGISVFNTVIEPNWKGFLTLEIVFHGNEPITLEAGTPIAQVIFHSLTETSEYNGKYQNQKDMPVVAISEGSDQ